VRVLVLNEVDDLQDAYAIDLIAEDEPGVLQLIQPCIDVDVVGREELHADALWTILETPFPVGQCPQPSKEEPDLERQLDQELVGEEPRLDEAGPGHGYLLQPLSAASANLRSMAARPGLAAASSTQISNQSCGRRSMRETTPLVACSMRMLVWGDGRLAPLAICHKDTGEMSISLASAAQFPLFSRK